VGGGGWGFSRLSLCGVTYFSISMMELRRISERNRCKWLSFMSAIRFLTGDWRAQNALWHALRRFGDGGLSLMFFFCLMKGR
jgi:hypothetical protein